MGSWTEEIVTEVYSMSDKEDTILGEKLVARLETVIDPEAKLNVIIMGLIKELEVEDGRVKVVFRPTRPTCPMANRIGMDIKEAIESVEGVKELQLTAIDYQNVQEFNETMKSTKQ